MATILVIGSGGREHALAWKLARSPEAERVLLAPGNDGAALEPEVERIAIGGSDYDAMVELAQKESVDLVVVGPDNALADGLVDRMQREGFTTFGPSARAAKIESSKAYAKELMRRQNIPTAGFNVFTEVAAAKQYLKDCGWKSGWAIKADGLALGKGVVVTEDLAEAEAAIDAFMVQKTMGAAGERIVIEERLVGREVSAFYLCDGKTALELGFACDYKQIFDGNQGPNTGGMGAYGPPDWLPADFGEQVNTRVVQPLLQDMRESGHPFQGCLFIGFIVSDKGFKVLEFNARFGDPETQVLMPLLESDLFPALQACADGELSTWRGRLELKRQTAVHIVLAAHGYPGTGGQAVRKGDSIRIPADLMPGNTFTDRKLFFAGVQGEDKDSLVTSGGRVLGLTVLGADKAAARKAAYDCVRGIQFADAQMRTDIAK